MLLSSLPLGLILGDIKQHMPDMLELCLALHAFQFVCVQTVLCRDNVCSSDSSAEHSFFFAMPSTCLQVKVYKHGLFKDAWKNKQQQQKMKTSTNTFFVLILVATTLNCWHLRQEAHPLKSNVVQFTASWLLVWVWGCLECRK